MPPTSTGLSDADHPRRAVAIAAFIRPRTRDRVRVGDAASRARGRLFDFATPTPNRVQNSMNALTARPQEQRHEREAEARPADDRAAPEAVGQPPHRQRAEHEERARRRS